jgi:four helix bundle protein
MSNKETFRDLIVWQKAIQLSKRTYQITQNLPDTEKFGLTAQMRRASVSIPSNIAEGNARQSLRDYLKFLAIARGSLAELETQLIIASELGMLQHTQSVMEEIQEVRRILQGLIDSLRKKQNQTP